MLEYAEFPIWAIALYAIIVHFPLGLFCYVLDLFLSNGVEDIFLHRSSIHSSFVLNVPFFVLNDHFGVLQLYLPKFHQFGLHSASLFHPISELNPSYILNSPSVSWCFTFALILNENISWVNCSKRNFYEVISCLGEENSRIFVLSSHFFSQTMPNEQYANCFKLGNKSFWTSMLSWRLN